MTDTLYIIGNGFDLHHGLKTSYSNFRDDHAKKGSLWNDLLDIYGDSQLNDEYWWRDFENMLGRIDYSNLINTRNGEPVVFTHECLSERKGIVMSHNEYESFLCDRGLSLVILEG